MAGTQFQRTIRNYTFHIPQEELAELEVIAPLSSKQEQYLNDDKHDIIVWGGAAGSGKTQISLIRIMMAAMTDPNYVAAITRKSQKMIKGSGSIWHSGCNLFLPYDVASNQLDMSWRFPNGASVKCNYLWNNQDDWQGTQITEALVDEGAQCQLDDVWYLTSRLRSKSDRRHQLRITTNPDRDSFLKEWLDKGGYLDEEGFPIEEMDGATRYLVQINGGFEFYRTKAEIRELYGKEAEEASLSFTFYAATVMDNPWIRKHQPAYIHKLRNMKRVQRDQLLHGNWNAKEEAEGFLQREMFEEVELSSIPLGLPTARAWDLASTKPSETNPDPDYSIGIKMAYDRDDGTLYILDVVRLRDRAAVVERTMIQTAREDGKGIYQVIPQDPGSAGKQVAQQKKSRLMREGSKVLLSLTRGSKLTRAEAFIIAAQAKQVKVLKGAFDNQTWLELEGFDGQNRRVHDDVIDALADGYNALATGRLMPSLSGLTANRARLESIGGRTLL